MSKEYNYETRYETLQSEWKIQCKRTPRGVTLAKGGNNIYLQFKTPNTTRSKYKCACMFTENGIHEAVRKSHLVKAKLTNLTSEVEFWDWYKKEIEEESRLVNDRITFGEAIKKVEDDFWSRLSRTKRKRDKASPSDLSSWYDTYGSFYKWLDPNEEVSLSQITHVISKWKKGRKIHGYAVSAMKKLAEINRRRDICEALSEIDVTQTEFLELQSIDLDSFLDWRNKVLGINTTLSPRVNMNTRKAWMWVFSTQIVYALRISEVFAIKNLFEPYVSKDGVPIPALSDPDNTENLIYIGGKTVLGTTVKTGDRLSRPQIPPKYPDLIERLDIKQPLVPNNKPRSKKASTVRRFFTKTARDYLSKWDAPFTQTHADRNLGNINGMQAGIPLEVRAQSMGHTRSMNDSNYKKRIGTKTQIDLLLNSNTNAIDFVTALAEAKKLVTNDGLDRDSISKLLSIIYQKDIKAINELL